MQTCYTNFATGERNSYDDHPHGWGEEPPAESVPGESVIETPIGSEEIALQDPSLRSKIQKLEAAGKKVITKVGKGKITLIILGGALAVGVGIAVEEGVRRHKKPSLGRKRQR